MDAARIALLEAKSVHESELEKAVEVRNDLQNQALRAQAALAEATQQLSRQNDLVDAITFNIAEISSAMALIGAEAIRAGKVES